MISHLSGTLLKKDEGSVIIDVAGVGYTVYCSSDTFLSLPDIGKMASVWTHLSVRETAMNLYGFSTREELSLFKLLIEVPGIGPKSGLAILSLATVPTLKKSISSGDTTYLTKVSGVGKKSAEKIVLELRDKLGVEDGDGPDLKSESDVVDALLGLGYTLKESRDALKNVPSDVTDTGERIKIVLRLLGK